MENIWRKAILTDKATIQDVISNLDKVAIRIVLVVDDSGKLQGTISDGDVRRGLLRGLDLKSSVGSVVHRNPLVVPPEVSKDTVRQLMISNKIQQIPVINEKNNVVGLHLWDEITRTPVRSNLLVIMAGGKGTRLRPYTENCPKPMLQVAGKPMLEHIIERAKLEGFSHFVLAINYLGHIIEDHFGNGERFHVRIDYLREQAPLGTAGALGLLDPNPELAFLVTNGDVLTDIHYGELLDFHSHHNAAATMAVRVHEWQHPYGVVKTDGIDIIGFEEKPVHRSHINAGVYVLEPEALGFLERNVHCDMPTLFERLKEINKRTAAYPIHEPWLDVGKQEDLIRAISEKEKNK
ncbi:MAG: nucleotidyltransferase family protein [Deltaproteobacteria bacterium]|nr:nucleotidyltransferase family protein [Deltaproteobacteria bacterium]